MTIIKSICLQCWKKEHGKTKPQFAPSPETTHCAECGKENQDGIFVAIQSNMTDHGEVAVDSERDN